MSLKLLMTSAEQHASANYYIGLMSGTSADGIDLALVSFDNNSFPTLHASYYQPYSQPVISKITSLYVPGSNEIDLAFSLDVELAQLFAQAITALLTQQKLTTTDIIAIGNHGQTIRHRPQGEHPFTLQIGCCQTLATLTGIRVIGQFRRKDMALGGQGAPLVPAFHEKIFQTGKPLEESSLTTPANDVFVANIGGIANITYLPARSEQAIVGYDTGTGNALMDDWFQLHHPLSECCYDKNGEWAASGTINDALLKHLLSDLYFQRTPPKSTGREYFNSAWLEQQLAKTPVLASADVQATLCAFTAKSLVDAINQHYDNHSDSRENDQNKATVYLCGGGAHNSTLVENIRHCLVATGHSYQLANTEEKGVNGDQLEAIAFAWLAFAYDKKLISNMPAVTGASKACTLGTAFIP